MEFYEALEVMKRGESVQHGGKTYKLMHHAIYDITDEKAPKRLRMTPEAWAELDPIALSSEDSHETDR